jgi:hypothetical protein
VGAEYDALKIVLFNLLYCAGDEMVKQTILYETLVGHSDLKPVKPNDEGLITRLETLIVIPTLLLANIIE